VQAWGSLQATKAQVQSAQAQVASSETALNGVREESRVGQRTTIDVLNAQQTLVNARIALAVALHDRVVTSYSVLSATGRLSPQVLSLQTPTYDPTAHYQQVRDAWFGLRTPDGDPNFNLTSEDYRPAHTSEAASASASGMARDNPKETGDQQATGDVAIQPQPTGDGDRKPQPEPLAPLRTTPVALTGAPTVIANQGGPAGAAAKPHSKPRPMPMAAPGRDDDTRPMAGSTAQTPSSRAPRLMPGAQPLVPVGSFSGRMAAPKARPQPAQPEDPEPEPAPRKPIGGSTASNGGLMPGAQPLVPAGVNDLNSFSAVR